MSLFFNACENCLDIYQFYVSCIYYIIPKIYFCNTLYYVLPFGSYQGLQRLTMVSMLFLKRSSLTAYRGWLLSVQDHSQRPFTTHKCQRYHRHSVTLILWVNVWKCSLGKPLYTWDIMDRRTHTDHCIKTPVPCPTVW